VLAVASGSARDERHIEDALGGADARIIGVRFPDAALQPQSVLDRRLSDASAAAATSGNGHAFADTLSNPNGETTDSGMPCGRIWGGLHLPQSSRTAIVGHPRGPKARSVSSNE
jgi:hypothetical protein